MDIYSSKEKDDVLNKIIAEDYISLYEKREMSIADNFLSPMGLIEISMKLVMPDHYVCISTQKGKDFMAAGGFAQIQQEENEKAEHEKEKQELVRLQRESLEYQKTIRHQETIIRLQHKLHPTTKAGSHLLFPGKMPHWRSVPAI